MALIVRYQTKLNSLCESKISVLQKVFTRELIKNTIIE